MLIGVCGPPNAGKTAVANFLVSEHAFYYVCNLTDFILSDRRLVKEEAEITPNVAQSLSECWRSDVNVVIDNVVPMHPALPDLMKRPYFLLIYVDAPTLVRFHRASDCGQARGGLESFLKWDDCYTYCGKFHVERLSADGILEDSGEKTRCLAHANGGRVSPSRHNETLISLRKLARLHVVNDDDDIKTLFEALRQLNVTNPERLRPGWDSYFMSLAKLASERTNCMKRRVGCVVARNQRVVATGYNGTPSGVTNCWSGGCPRCNNAQSVSSSQGGIALDLCLCLHAEENAIIEAGRDRCENATLYCNLFPCVLCAKKIVQAGISRVVFERHYAMDAASSHLLQAGNVKVEQYKGDYETNRSG